MGRFFDFFSFILRVFVESVPGTGAIPWSTAIISKEKCPRQSLFTDFDLLKNDKLNKINFIQKYIISIHVKPWQRDKKTLS